MTFYWFLPLKLLIFTALLYLVALPFINHYKKTGSPFTERKLPYIMTGLLVIAFVISPFKLTANEQSERVIRSFDAPLETELPEIRTHSREVYEAPSNINEYNQTIKTGE